VSPDILPRAGLDEGLKKPKVSLAPAEKTFMLIRPLSLLPVGRTS
jgi:hypothetical protein